MFNKFSALAAVAVSGALAGLERLRPRQPHHYGQTRYIGGYRPARSKYMPHQGEREIARRLRQQARIAARKAQG